MNNSTSLYRVKVDAGDWRDLIYTPVKRPLQETVDLRKWASPVENQRHLGSCTGNAVVGAYELLLNKYNKNSFVDLSRLFVYYNARLLEDSTDEDSGAYIRDAIKAVKKYGICTESVWPYNISKFALSPSELCYTDAKTRNIKNYYRLLSLGDILDALNNDRPVVFGMKVYNAFDQLDVGNCIVPLPGAEEQPIGGHAMCLVGYDLSKQLLLARNSFGPEWCNKGYCWIPFEYATNEFFDMWVFDIDIDVKTSSLLG